MQTLYGIKITDRVRVLENDNDFLVYFDGQYIATERSGRAAVNAAKNWLEKRGEQREKEVAAAAEAARHRQAYLDDVNTDKIAEVLGVGRDVIDKLFEIFERKLKDR